MGMSSPTGNRWQRPLDPFGDETRAYAAHLLWRLALAVTLSAAVSVVAGTFAVSTISPLRLGALVILLIAGVAGVALARAGRIEVGRRAFVLLMLIGYLAMTLPTAFRTMPSTLVGLWILAWLAVLVVAAGLLLGRVWALAITVAGVGALIFALVPSVGRPANTPMSGALVLLSGAAVLVGEELGAAVAGERFGDIRDGVAELRLGAVQQRRTDGERAGVRLPQHDFCFRLPAAVVDAGIGGVGLRVRALAAGEDDVGGEVDEARTGGRCGLGHVARAVDDDLAVVAAVGEVHHHLRLPRRDLVEHSCA